MKKMQAILMIIVICFSTIFMALSIYATEGDKAINDDKIKRIEEYIEKNMKKGKIPGLSVAVVEKEKTIYEKNFGYSDVKNSLPITSDTVFEIGSNSKAFTALAILELEQENKLNLDETVDKYIPGLTFKFNNEKVHVTIKEFLNQTSGIPFKTIDSIPESNEKNALEKTVQNLKGIELDSKPGEEFQYATINYDVLGLIIEKITGKTYEDYMNEEIFKKLGLNNTYLNTKKEDDKNLAKGYMINALKSREYNAPIYKGNNPAGYIRSNIEDMSKWLKIQMNAIEVDLDFKEIIKKSHEINKEILPNNDGSSYNYGWYIMSKDEGEIFHGGNNPNYSSYTIMNPKNHTGVVVLSNSNSTYSTAIAEEINRIINDGPENFNKITDMNKDADIISIIIIASMICIIVITLFFMFIGIKEIFKGIRVFNFKGIKTLLQGGLSLIFMGGVSYAIYLIPSILYAGLSWKFVSVWLPKTAIIALITSYIAIWLVYIYIVATTLWKKDKDKAILTLSILSLLSGIGNAIIIFTINLSINSDNTLKLKLLVYFALGIVLYVYGQKVMRVKMIEVANGIVFSKRMKIATCLLKSSYSKFESLEPGVIQATLNNDTEVISDTVNFIIGGVTSVITLICCFAYLAFVNLYALLFAVGIILVIASIYFMAGQYANKIWDEARTIQNVFFGFIDSLTSGIKELNLSKKRRDQFREDMKVSCLQYRDKRTVAALAFANMFVIGELLFTLAIGIITLVFPMFLKSLTVADITTYVFILLYMTGPVHGVLDVIPALVNVRISFNRIDDLIKRIENNDEDIKVSKIKDNNVDLKLNAVKYKYNSEEENGFKIGPITYEFKSGEIVFITGGNGSGKSTLGKLITGLYDVSEGYITLNNKKVSSRELNENYSTVFSDFYLFDKLYGIDYSTKQEEIKKYLEILKLTDKVEIIDGKFSTTKLSTGQKKRLALLVTYLEDRNIYFFDEWAADQDPEFRMFFYNELLPDLKHKGKCVIAVTHDEHYFNCADKVLKLEFGELLESTMSIS